ncbi:MAG TPA: hydroxymethylglutaryl-CoA lyase [Terriglobia bacterium]|nr:hydroxymethylglutaryl-CoA lyase [Terriglobia bacterium]
MEKVKIIECPRDAWQGLEMIIPTEAKLAYLHKLIECGFRHIDAVSFVAPKYVPQMADSERVMEALYPDIAPNSESRTPNPEIIGIVVNEQGLQRALKTPGVATIGYPYSVSAYFRRANANMSKEESQTLVEKLQRAVSARPNGPNGNEVQRGLVVYISMAFGNPYDEPWGPEIVEETVEWLKRTGVKTVSLADTVGKAEPQAVGDLFRAVKSAAEGLELGVHLHSRPDGAAEKVLAAYEAGCRRFDSALTGLGGCPFAGDDLVGNIPTEIVVSTLHGQGATTGIEPWALLSAVEATREIRKQYADH